MTVQISWRIVVASGAGDEHAEFFVGELPDFNGGGQVTFGRESDNGRRWTGKIPRTGDYYIYVMGYPTVRYILRVTLK
jgi:hypothetical protein